HLRIVVGPYLLAAGCHLGHPLFDSPKQNALVDLKLDHRVELETTLRQKAVECLGLTHRSREAIQHEARPGIGLVDAVGDDRHHALAGHRIAAIHNAFCAQTDRRAGGSGGAQHVTGRELDNSVFGYQALRLRALTRPRRAEQDQSHRVRPRSFDRLISPSYWCASKYPWICATVSMVTLTTISNEVPPK